MKVLFANKFFYLKGGSERVYFQARKCLQERGVSVVDFSMQDSRNFGSRYSSLFVRNVDYQNRIGGALAKCKSAVRFVHSAEAVAKVGQLVERERPEIAHLHNIYHQLTPSIIPALKEQGVKILLTLHDFKLICPAYLAVTDTGQVCSVCKGKGFYKTLRRHCQGSRSKELLLALEAYYHLFMGSYDGVDIFLAPSHFLADMIGGYRVPKAKIRVLRNGIDVSSFYPCGQDDGYGLYVGRLSHEKGVATLLAAHRKWGETERLKVVGTGPLEKKLESCFPMAEFLGFKYGEELYDLIRRSAFVVVPSECYENCPMVVLEAMASGKPVIGSRIGGLPEQIEDGRTGLLFEMGNADELADKMKLLARNPEMRKAMGVAAREKVEREYSLEAHCAALIKIYEGLLSAN